MRISNFVHEIILMQSEIDMLYRSLLGVHNYCARMAIFFYLKREIIKKSQISR